MKHHNVCKRHGFLDTGFKQTKRIIFLQWDQKKYVTTFKFIFEEIVSKLSVHFLNRNSQDSQEPISQPYLEFRSHETAIEQQMLIKFSAEVPYLYYW